MGTAEAVCQVLKDRDENPNQTGRCVGWGQYINIWEFKIKQWTVRKKGIIVSWLMLAKISNV